MKTMRVTVTELKKIIREEADRVRLREAKKDAGAKGSSKRPAPIAKPDGDQDPDGADELEKPIDWVKVLKLRESSLKRRLEAVQNRLARVDNKSRNKK